MKKIGAIIRETSQNRIKGYLQDSASLLVIKYSGLSGPDLNQLRRTLRLSGSTMLVVKNSVARRALKDTKLEQAIKAVEGPCGLVFSKDEPVAVSRALCGFAKEREKLKIECGFLQDRALQLKDIEELAKLPSREILRAKAVMLLNSPISRLAIALNQLLVKLVICLDQIKKKKI